MKLNESIQNQQHVSLAEVRGVYKEIIAIRGVLFKNIVVSLRKYPVMYIYQAITVF